MSHSILSLGQDRFDARIVLGGCLINIGGETVECTVAKDNTNFRNPTYTVTKAHAVKALCTFRPYHVHGGPMLYQIEGASAGRGDATLVVPAHGMLSSEDEDE